ncbi:hypothetical protein [Streptomyces sp. NPDC058394]
MAGLTRLDALGGEVGSLGQKLDSFITEQRSVNAMLVELARRTRFPGGLR